MRLIVFFDLPTTTSKDIKTYTKFRKFLINEGFIMIQQSVYCKLALNNSIADSLKNKIKNNAPKKGNVQLLIVTEKQYSSIILITGANETKILDSTERLTVI